MKDKESLIRAQLNGHHKPHEAEIKAIHKAPAEANQLTRKQLRQQP